MGDVSTSIVGLAPATTAGSKIDMLVNVYEEPLDPEGISSAVLSVKIDQNGSQGVANYNVVEWLTSLDSTKAGLLVACSMDGNLHVREQGQWRVIASGTEQGLNQVVALSDGTAYAVAEGGQIVKLADHKASIDYPGTGIRLNGIHGCSPTCVYAVGDEGQIVHFDGRKWKALEPLTNVNLITVLCVAVDDVYVAGGMGMVFHWNGNVWKRVPAPEVTLTSIARFKGKTYLAAGIAGVHVVNGEAVEHFKQLILHRLRAVDDLMFGVGGDLLAWFDGSGWRGGPFAVS